MPRGKNTAAVPAARLDVPVEFGGVSFGAETARLGVSINRDHMSLLDADSVLSGHRLTGEVRLGGNGAAEGQMKLVDDLEHAVAGIFDVKGVNVKPKQFTAGLTFSVTDIEPGELVKFAKGKGRLIVRDVSALPEKGEAGVPAEDEREE